MHPRPRLAIALTALALTTSCSTSPPAESLTATLINGDNITLSWHNTTPTPAGDVVEYSNAPSGSFTPLDFVPPTQTTYAHQKLIPDTAFYYRVVPYFGPTTNTVTVNLPPGPTDNDPGDWANPATLPSPPPHASVHTEAGAPANLHATIEDPGGIRLTWTDNDTDAAGYFVEIKQLGSTTFQVAQALSPKTNACGIVAPADQKHLTIRIRAFYYGTPSNTAMQHTD